MHIVRAPRRTRPIPLTPLIDVVFLLIVFFMLSTTFIRIEAMELGLPGKGEGKASGPMPALVDVASNGRIYWQRELVLGATLRKKLAAELARNPDRKILVRSGKDVTVQKLVSVLDIVYLTGVNDVAVDKWDERDLPRPAEESEEGGEMQKLMEENDAALPVLKDEEVEALPQGEYSPQEALDQMMESMP